jgi:acyl-CoA thioesterase-1
MRTYLLILTCVALAGCTKTEAPRQEIPPARTSNAAAPRPAAADARPVIAVLGDSLAEGMGVAKGKSYPDIVQQTLDRKGYSYRVMNLGVSGDTTTGGLSRLAYALSLKPSILVIELGGNDGLRGIPVSSTKANLEKMIRESQKAGVDVLLAGMTLPPNYGTEYIRKFEAVYHDLAREYKVQLIPSLMRPIAEQIESRPELMQQDGIHPTAQGHELLGQTVVRYLMPMLRRS